MAFVYVIEAVGLTRVKIGFSRHDPMLRLDSIQRHSPVPLRLAYDVETEGDVRRLERYVHGLLHEHRLHNEWFGVTVDAAIAACEKAFANRPEAPKVKLFRVK